eukprot:11218529-Lingulodinium_polyedra.AAC.1
MLEARATVVRRAGTHARDAAGQRGTARGRAGFCGGHRGFGSAGEGSTRSDVRVLQRVGVLRWRARHANEAVVRRGRV